jgi:DNA-binding transcriptional LysR family regulator
MADSDGAARGYRSGLDDLRALRVFVTVVETGSLTEAARRLNIAPSTVSKHISALEAKVHGQLIVRSTKQIHVTELGRRFNARCQAIIQEVERTEFEVDEYNAEPQGVLRISAAPVFAVKHLAPVVARFLEKYPKVSVDLQLTNTEEDLVANGIDAAIRISSKLDDNLVAVKLAPNVRVYCAAPSYMAKHGKPSSVTDLVNHNCLIIQSVAQSAVWPMRREDGVIEQVAVTGTFKCNNGDMLCEALLQGMGIGHLARFMVYDHIASGDLVELFPESRVIASHIYVVFPTKRHMPQKTRAFVDHLRAEFQHPAAWATLN